MNAHATSVEVPDGPGFTLPTCFPPSHPVRGDDGRVTYRAETAALIDGYRNLLRHFAASLEIDPDRIALWGGSAGAQLALLLALTPGLDVGGSVGVAGEDEPVLAVVDFFGLTDIFALSEQEQSEGGIRSALLGGPVADHLERARLASPITHVHSEGPPMLVFHGTVDGLIPIDQSRGFVDAAQRTGMKAELVEVEGADHGFATIEMGGILDQCVSFLAAHLRNAPATTLR